MDDYTGDIRLELLPRTLYFDLSQDLMDVTGLNFNIQYKGAVDNIIYVPFTLVDGSTFEVNLTLANINTVKDTIKGKYIDTSYDTKHYLFKYSITTADDIFAYGSIAFIKV